LNKGLQYSLHTKNKRRIETSAIKADAAINHINIHEQQYRVNIAKNNRQTTKATKRAHTKP
jgi:hypothetical protein